MGNDRTPPIEPLRLAVFTLGAFVLLVAARIVVEMWVLGGHLRVPIFTHQLAWFLFVLTWFAASLRRLAGLGGRALALLPLAGVVVFVPIVWGILSGQEIRFEYYFPRSVPAALFDMGTLLYFHETNHLMFPELALLLAGTIALAGWSSRSVPRTVAAALVAFYGFFFLAGFSTIRVGKSTEALWLLDSGLDPHAFYSFQYIAMSLLAGAWLLGPDLFARRRTLSEARSRWATGGIILACYGGLAAAAGGALTAADVGVAFVPVTALAVFAVLLVRRRLDLEERLIGGLLPALTLFVIVQAVVARLTGWR